MNTVAQKTIVYIDAFNLYHGRIQFTPYKWLDLAKMCRLLLPATEHDIVKIKYFTARVSGRDDPASPLRQQVYFRALRTCPYLEIIEGRFTKHKKPMLLADHPGYLARVVKTEEKGSDVNLATHLLIDAFSNTLDCAVLVCWTNPLPHQIRQQLVETDLAVKALAVPTLTPAPIMPAEVQLQSPATQAS